MKILVVEDEPKMLRAVRRGLERDGYAVDAVLTGEDALSYGTEYDYDAIVLDVMIPDLDGFGVCTELRYRDRWAPILMLTARDAVDDRIHGLDAGADDYLVKPFAFGELLARVRALVRRGPRERPAILIAGDITLDPATHTARSGDRAIELSPKEFALLEYLIRRAGQVVTRTELLEHVWDYNYGGVSNVVDVYVGYLRRKLRDAGSTTGIRTVRGVGYLLEAS